VPNRSLGKILGPIGLLLPFVIMPFFIGEYQLNTMVYILIWILVGVSYRLLATTGEFSLGHVVVMGIGAYTSALLGRNFGLPFYVTMPLGGLVSLAFAAATAYPLFRMRGFYFLIGSFAIGEAIRLIWRRAKDLFGGEGGISYIPKAEIGGFIFDSTFSYYWLTLGVVAGCLAFLYLVDRSRFGTALEAIHYQDPLCESVGINVPRYKMSAYMIASFFAGIAGGLLAHFQGAISPPQFALSFQLFVLVWVIVGGTNTFWGPIAGVITLYLIQEALRGTFAEFMPLIYGVILIAMVFGLPDGFEGLPDRIRGWRMSLKSRRAT